jgi:hypothetical protein
VTRAGKLAKGRPSLARAVRKVWADHDVTRRRFLLIDADSVRPAGIFATDDEHTAAINRVMPIREDLRLESWPEPFVGDSGNGGHLMFPIDLPADDGGLIERVLHRLAEKYNDEQVGIDQTVFNPARIWKLYGTKAGNRQGEIESPVW